jgi:RNA-directed DNA polymerase
LDKLGIPRATFYRWYDRYREGGPEALDDRRPRPDRVWNRIPDNVRRQIIDLALDLPELSPRELAVRFTDERKYFVSEASVYRLLKAHDLITSPAYVMIKAANEFRDKTTAICPSAYDLRLIRRFEKGGSGSSGLEFKRPAADAASGGLRWLYA